jgi:hypothetical protein
MHGYARSIQSRSGRRASRKHLDFPQQQIDFIGGLGQIRRILKVDVAVLG